MSRDTNPIRKTSTRSGAALAVAAAVWIVLTSAYAASAQTITLEQAVQTALSYNPTLAASRAQVEIFEGEVAEERSRKQIKLTGLVLGQAQQDTPQIPATNGLPARILGEDINASLDVTAEKTLYSSGRIPSAIRRAEHLSLGDQLRHERLRQEVVHDTRTAFYNLLAAQMTLETAQEEYQSTGEHLAVAQALYKADTVAKLDVIRAQVQHSEARQRLIEAENMIALTREALAVAMGTPDISIDAVTPSEQEIDTAELDTHLSYALQNRPDLLAARQAIRAAEAGVGAARAEDKPTIKAYLSQRSYATETPLQLSGWYAGMLVNVPILDGGYAKAKRRQAQSNLARAESSAVALENTAQMDVKQAYASLTSARAQQEVAAARVEQAEEAYRLAALRYKSGVATSVEVTDAQSALTAARNSWVKSKLDMSAAHARLALATGEPINATGGTEQ